MQSQKNRPTPEIKKEVPPKVIIDPRARIAYASYYIQGLIDMFGVKNVSFRMDPFKKLIQKNDESAFDQYFSFIINDKGQTRKIVIDYKDSYPINTSAYEWCDVYGKVNFNTEKTDRTQYARIIPIGPGFGIKIWNNPKTLFKAVVNFIRCRRFLNSKLYPFFYGYYWQTRRLPFSGFNSIPADGSYVFFVSSLWTQENCIKTTNVLRAFFVKSSKSLNINFEGGLYAKPSNPEYRKYEDLVYTEFISFPTYLKKIQKSSVVFNTPSVYNCHGWKLGEFFALGKAIISTPLSNAMPVELEHGKNIHIINDKSELAEALHKILEDNNYRAELEKGASEYFQKYLSPIKVIEKLLSVN